MKRITAEDKLIEVEKSNTYKCPKCGCNVYISQYKDEYNCQCCGTMVHKESGKSVADLAFVTTLKTSYARFMKKREMANDN